MKTLILLSLLWTLGFTKESWLNNENLNTALNLFETNTTIENETNLQNHIDKLHSITKSHLQRKKQVRDDFETIQELFYKNELPICLSYIPFAESNFQTHVKGYGTAGLWQFTKSSAKRLGLKVTKKNDERKNLQKSTKAAITYLKRLQKIYQKPYLVDFAYGLGEGTLQKILNSTPNPTFNEIWNHRLMKHGTRAHFTKILLLCSANEANYSTSTSEEEATQTGTAKLFQEALSEDEATTINQSVDLLKTP